MSRLNPTAAIASRPLSSGRLETRLEFAESSPDITPPPSFMIDPLHPAPIKNPTAGNETLSDAMKALKG